MEMLRKATHSMQTGLAFSIKLILIKVRQQQSTTTISRSNTTYQLDSQLSHTGTLMVSVEAPHMKINKSKQITENHEQIKKIKDVTKGVQTKR